MAASVVSLDEAWNAIDGKGIKPLEHYLETGEIPETSGGPGAATAVPEPQYDSDGKLLPQKRGLFRHGTYIQLYTLVYSLCTQKCVYNYTAKLYDAHYEAIRSYIQRKVVPALEAAQASCCEADAQEFLHEMNRRWESHKVYNHWMERIFTYLDRHYVRAFGKVCLSARGKDAFFELVFQPFSTFLKNALLHQVDLDRNNPAAVDRMLVRNLVHIYADLGNRQSLGLYVRDFEAPLLQRARAYYRQRSAEWMGTTNFSGYLQYVETTMESERKLCKQCFPEVTEPKLLAVVQIAILTDRMTELLAMNEGMAELLKRNDTENLQRAYRVFGLLESGFTPLAAALKEFVASCGNEVVDRHCEQLQGEAKLTASGKVKPVVAEKQLVSNALISEMLELHDRFLRLIALCFERTFVFQKAMKEGFENFINREIATHTMAALLSTYCDQLLRGRINLPTNVGLEALLSQLVSLFEYLLDKDLFIEIYRNQLARRLLSSSSNSTDAERMMLSQLKLTCGSVYTSRMEGMLSDLQLAVETDREFRKHLEETGGKLPLRNNFSSRVLTCGHWPAYQTPALILPPAMATCADVFAEWYVKQHTNHRKVTWIHHLGSATIIGTYDSVRSYWYLCNTYQAALLLCFNEQEKDVPLQQLHDWTGIEIPLARKHLTCLQVAKIISRTKAGSEEQEDTYSVNTKINLKQKLLKVPVPAQEDSHAKERAQEDRSVAIDAAIVRCMKQRKTCKHAVLVAEVIQMLPMFKPTPKRIKQKIEDLIQRDFLQRDPQDATNYVYVA